MKGFDDLSNADKVQLVINNAVFVTSVKQYCTTAKLYSLSNVFIEIVFNTVTDDIDEINVLNTDSLERYLKRIELPEF